MTQEKSTLAPEALKEHVLHLPKPGDLGDAAAERCRVLEGVRYLVLVGSPRRARSIAQLAHERLGARHDADGACYCDLTRPGRDEVGREFAVYGLELAGGARVAVASHGVGKAGVEIVLAELPALIALIQDGEAPELRGVLRCGTRGTLAGVPKGSVALSTSCFDETMAVEEPSPRWLDRLRGAARARSMRVIGRAEIDGLRGEAGAPLLVEGAGISTSFFWEGQGRRLFGAPYAEADRAAGDRLLRRWVEAGVVWVEMEDYTVLRLARRLGIPAATLGAVVGQRVRADGGFESGYDKAILAASELLPPELALEAIRADAAG